MKSSTHVLSCIAILGLALSPMSHVRADVSSSDKSFVKKASQGGMTEVEAGKLAQEKAKSQDVKDFGAMMVKEHSQNDMDLMALAKTKNVMVSDKLDSTHQRMIDKMSGMSGASFDKAYVKDQIAGHKKMLALMKSEESSKDADMKDFATKTAATVQTHLDHAMELEKSMK